ncbi:MAG: aminotransferase class I/II-fold pyridoxal phosphate-dependent enzyme, partial [Desulfohalobiaceae bacterium]|nr:aminotransferase class I/II-fold pyridoxal phosphate-dependent enzyme [Desulfohalobiaceae bacterium]
TLAQFMLLEFIKQGHLAERIRSNTHFYRHKRDFMLQKLDEHFPKAISWTRPQGGFFIFLRLPEDWDAADLLQEAVDRDVAFVTGQPFFVDGSGKNTLRLSFSQASQEDIQAAITELGELLTDRISTGI